MIRWKGNVTQKKKEKGGWQKEEIKTMFGSPSEVVEEATGRWQDETQKNHEVQYTRRGVSKGRGGAEYGDRDAEYTEYAHRYMPVSIRGRQRSAHRGTGGRPGGEWEWGRIS